MKDFGIEHASIAVEYNNTTDNELFVRDKRIGKLVWDVVDGWEAELDSARLNATAALHLNSLLEYLATDYPNGKLS